MVDLTGCEANTKVMKERGFNCNSPMQVALCIVSVESAVLKGFLAKQDAICDAISGMMGM